MSSQALHAEPAMHELACVIVGRNLGDAVMHSAAVSRLAQRGFAKRFLIWTRPQVAFLFESLPGVRMVLSQFPLGTTKHFGWREARAFVRSAWTVRRAAPDVTVDFIGDVRERWCARLAGSRRHLHIGWDDGHPFRRMIRAPLGPGHPVVSIPKDAPSHYDALRVVVDAMTPGAAATHRPAGASRRVGDRSPLRIGLHPFASQPCREWPRERWQRLAELLLAEGHELVAFGAPSERDELTRIFGPAHRRLTFVTDSLASFFERVGGLDLMIGLDSFSIHLAHHRGVPTVLINGANLGSMVAPPDAIVLAKSGGCRNYPCYNKPDCVGTPREYACIRAISPQEVAEAALRGRAPNTQDLRTRSVANDH